MEIFYKISLFYFFKATIFINGKVALYRQPETQFGFLFFIR